MRDLVDSLAAKGKHFIKPIGVIGEYPRIMSLSDATRKMSKSNPDDYSWINLDDSPDTIALKIKAAKTAPSPSNATPETANLQTLYKAFGGTREHDRWKSFKDDLTDFIIRDLHP